jgi:hypothetical protein
MLYLSGITGSILAMIIMMMAPGNVDRKALFPPPPSLFTLALRTFQETKNYALVLLNNDSFVVSIFKVVLVAFLISVVIFIKNKIKSRTILLGLMFIALSSLVIISATLAPSLWGESMMPEARTLYLITSSFVIFAAFFGVFLAAIYTNSVKYLGGWSGKTIATLLFATVLVLSLRTVDKVIENFKIAEPSITKVTEAWDAREIVLKSSSGKNVIVNTLGDTGGLGDITATKNGTNVCVADYYGLKSISGR